MIEVNRYRKYEIKQYDYEQAKRELTGPAHLGLRYGFRSPAGTYQIPLLATLIPGGLPLLYDLQRKLLKREFSSDLLGGISFITSIVLGEYLAGSIIVLMLAGGESLESYALRSASSVLSPWG